MISQIPSTQAKYNAFDAYGRATLSDMFPKARLDRGTVRFANRKKGKHPHEVLTNLQLVEPIISRENQSTQPKIRASIEEKRKADDYLLEHGITRFALIHPGARKALRRWDKYAELATWLKKEKQLVSLDRTAE